MEIKWYPNGIQIPGGMVSKYIQMYPNVHTIWITWSFHKQEIGNSYIMNLHIKIGDFP